MMLSVTFFRPKDYFSSAFNRFPTGRAILPAVSVEDGPRQGDGGAGHLQATE